MKVSKIDTSGLKMDQFPTILEEKGKGSLLPNKQISSISPRNKEKKQEQSINTSDKNSVSFSKELKPEEQKKVEELKRIDSKVRAHELAHLAAGGGLVRGGANFTYQTGPDGKQYVVAGEVKIDMSVDPDNPEASIRKMQQVRRAALAPADPSPQDRSVAQQASNIESRMRVKLQQEKNIDKNSKLQIYKLFDIQPEQYNEPPKTSHINIISNSPGMGVLKHILDAKV